MWKLEQYFRLDDFVFASYEWFTDLTEFQLEQRMLELIEFRMRIFRYIQLTEYEVGRFALYEVKSCCSFYIR